MTKNRLLILIFLILTNHAYADAELSKIEMLSKVTAKYKSFDTFTADIEKTTLLKALDIEKKHRGKLIFSKDKIKLDIVSPSKTLILFDKTNVTTVQYPEDKEFDDTIRVIKTKADSFLNEMLQGDFTKFKVLSISTKKNITTYEIIPKKKEETPVTKASVSIDTAKDLITQFSYWDTLENKTSFVFKNVVPNKEIDKKVFELKIPKEAITTEI